MNITQAFKKFVRSLTGKEPVGDNIADVMRNGANDAADFNELAVKYEAADKKSVVLASSTSGSKKTFRITVTDDGTVSAAEITE